MHHIYSGKVAGLLIFHAEEKFLQEIPLFVLATDYHCFFLFIYFVHIARIVSHLPYPSNDGKF